MHTYHRRAADLSKGLEGLYSHFSKKGKIIRWGSLQPPSLAPHPPNFKSVLRLPYPRPNLEKKFHRPWINQNMFGLRSALFYWHLFHLKEQTNKQKM